LDWVFKPHFAQNRFKVNHKVIFD